MSLTTCFSITTRCSLLLQPVYVGIPFCYGKLTSLYVINRSYAVMCRDVNIFSISRTSVIHSYWCNYNSTNSYPCTATCMLLRVYLIILILVNLWRRTMLWNLILNKHRENELLRSSASAAINTDCFVDVFLMVLHRVSHCHDRNTPIVTSDKTTKYSIHH